MKIYFHPNGLRIEGEIPFILKRKLKAQYFTSALRNNTNYTFIEYNQSEKNAIELYSFITKDKFVFHVSEWIINKNEFNYSYSEENPKQCFADLFEETFEVDLIGIRKEPRDTDICIGNLSNPNLPQPNDWDVCLSPRHYIKQSFKHKI